jgi:photosystem II stability/assembly factor-like uncharacterized protein
MNAPTTGRSIATAATALLGLALGAGVFTMPACLYCTVTFGTDPGEPIDLGVDSDLEAVADIGLWVDERSYDFLAAGAGGQVLVWGHDHPRKRSELFVRATVLPGAPDLHGVFVEFTSSESEQQAWWVVGEGGTIASSDNRGTSWVSAQIADGDLHAITRFAGQLVVVGDEVLLVRDTDGTWLEPTPPQEPLGGGWGQLRGVGGGQTRLYAVGLGGVVWSSEDPLGEWIAEDPGVTTDLYDVGPLTSAYGEFVPTQSEAAIVVGSQGTILATSDGVWNQADTGTTVDFLDFDVHYALAADGAIYDISDNGQLGLVETVEGARAIAWEDYEGLTTVGVDGQATTPPEDEC